jgi:hypothetical protein
MTIERLAFDRGSVRHYDAVGRLQVARSAISKSNVCEYYGREIPNSEALGLQPDKLYRLWRHPDELKKAAPTFNNIPILCVHTPDTPGDPPREYRVGVTHGNASFEAPYLFNGLSIWDNSAISGIETEEQKELSSSYAYVADMTPGNTPDGEPYDGVMRNIVGNHVALVTDGRAGSDVYVFDSLPPELKHMKLSNKAIAVRAALRVYLKPRLAQDAAITDLTTIVQSQKKPVAIAAAVKNRYSTLLAQDMDIDPMELAQLLESTESEVPPEGGDGDPGDGGNGDGDPAFDEDVDSILELLKGKVSDEALEKIRAALTPAATDADPDKTDPKPPEGGADKPVDRPAMDAAIRAATQRATAQATAAFNDLRAAELEVMPLVGQVIAMDSGTAVRKFALDSLGIDTTGVHPSAYASLIAMAKAQKATVKPTPLANDSAVIDSFSQAFPNAGKLKRSY